MKINYKRKHQLSHLIFGIIWLVFGILQVFVDERASWIDYGWFVIAAAYLGMYFYQRQYRYLTIENGFIRLHAPFTGKEMALDEIEHIRRFAGDYTLRSAERKLTINTQIIDPRSLEDLNQALEALDVKWS